MCVQKSDGSLKSAIHNAYRISLRPSSMREPRHPLLKVFSDFYLVFLLLINKSDSIHLSEQKFLAEAKFKAACNGERKRQNAHTSMQQSTQHGTIARAASALHTTQPRARLLLS